jgi:tetratricopeptide (TPR) repeat protein
VTDRPLLNFTLALNCAVSGSEVRSCRVGNWLVHVASALLLFGIVRRTFLLPSMRAQWGRVALALALVIALVWAVHPLPTESVAYYQKAPAIDPKDAEAHNNLGVVTAADRRLEEAARQMEAAPAINPGFAEAHCNLGSVMAACGLRDEAIRRYRRAIQIKPDYAKAADNLNRLLSSGR